MNNGLVKGLLLTLASATTVGTVMMNTVNLRDDDTQLYKDQNYYIQMHQDVIRTAMTLNNYQLAGRNPVAPQTTPKGKNPDPSTLPKVTGNETQKEFAKGMSDSGSKLVCIAGEMGNINQENKGWNAALNRGGAKRVGLIQWQGGRAETINAMMNQYEAEGKSIAYAQGVRCYQELATGAYNGHVAADKVGKGAYTYGSITEKEYADHGQTADLASWDTKWIPGNLILEETDPNQVRRAAFQLMISYEIPASATANPYVRLEGAVDWYEKLKD